MNNNLLEGDWVTYQYGAVGRIHCFLGYAASVQTNTETFNAVSTDILERIPAPFKEGQQLYYNEKFWTVAAGDNEIPEDLVRLQSNLARNFYIRIRLFKLLRYVQKHPILENKLSVNDWVESVKGRVIHLYTASKFDAHIPMATVRLSETQNIEIPVKELVRVNTNEPTSNNQVCKHCGTLVCMCVGGVDF